MKYTINGKGFKAKSGITEYTNTLLKSCNGDIVGDDFKFFKELLGYHPNKLKLSRLSNIVSMYSGDSHWGNNICLWLRYDNGQVEDASLTKCIANVPVTPIYGVYEFIFDFGKYKGWSAQQVMDIDPNYIDWVITNTTNRTTEVRLGQFKKWGYIPYNPLTKNS